MDINESAENYTEFNNPVKDYNKSKYDQTDINYQNASSGNPIINFLKSPTGQGSINSYDDHPLNFESNHFLSQTIRGLTGMIGSLDLAIIDVIIGIVGYFKKVDNV